MTLPARADISTWAQALGFDKIGITDVDLTSEEPHVRAWLDNGFAGEMGYLSRNLEKRLHPEQLVPQTCTVISARMNYLPADTQPLQVLEDSSVGYVSRYALGRDYHKVLRKRLARLGQQIDTALQGHVTEQLPHGYRAFTDSAPVLEKALGEKAGLGWIGKHTLLLDKEVGSWFFIGEIYTNAPFRPDGDGGKNAAGSPSNIPQYNQCGKCNACITVCPTQAIIGPKQLDARRCISYLTIEHKGSISEELRPLMGNRIYGCDDCQLYCPWNRAAPTTTEPDFSPRHGLANTSLVELFAMNEQTFDKMTEGSAMRRVSYEQWQRNLAIALGNVDDEGTYGPAIELLRTKLPGASNMVAEHINWALMRLQAKASV